VAASELMTPDLVIDQVPAYSVGKLAVERFPQGRIQGIGPGRAPRHLEKHLVIDAALDDRFAPFNLATTRDIDTRWAAGEGRKRSSRSASMTRCFSRLPRGTAPVDALECGLAEIAQRQVSRTNKLDWSIQGPRNHSEGRHGAGVRVLIQSQDRRRVGHGRCRLKNIIEASWIAPCG